MVGNKCASLDDRWGFKFKFAKSTALFIETTVPTLIAFILLFSTLASIHCYNNGGDKAVLFNMDKNKI